MADNKHTPGPWVAKQEFSNRWRIESHERGEEYVPVSVGLACTTILEVGCNDKDTEANAYLFAASPDLLDVAKCVREACLFDDDDGQIGVSEDVTISLALFSKICDAINKAEGRA